MSATLTSAAARKPVVCQSTYWQRFRAELPFRLLGLLSGALLGLSAPGFDQWYLAWFGMVPLLYLSVTASEPWVAGWRGWYFGLGYYLVYLSWYLSIRPTVWSGTFTFCPPLMSAGSWLMMGMWQALFVGIYSCVLNALPTTGGWLPAKRAGRWLMPSFVVVPIMWVAFIDKMFNSPDLLGVPWALIEYSQYKQPVILQAASVIGGTGIGAAIMLANATILGIICFRRPGLSPVSFPTKASLAINCLLSASLLLLIPAFGLWRLKAEAGESGKKLLTVSSLQGNLSNRIHKVDAGALLRKYLDLTRSCPPGLCLWPEWSLVLDRTADADMLEGLAKLAAERGQAWVVGTFDKAGGQDVYNAVSAIDADGRVLPEVYHKRYLVPFGEFVPDWVDRTPLGFILFGSKKRFEQTASGAKPVVFKMRDAAVTPIVCFENIMPKIVAEGVRAGGQLITDCSNTCWFYPCNLSDQMVAFSVMRAAENHRAFIFSTALGPSLIVDPLGRIRKIAPREAEAVVTDRVPVESDITPFTRFCF